jgi:hypothetical protein
MLSSMQKLLGHAANKKHAPVAGLKQPHLPGAAAIPLGKRCNRLPAALPVPTNMQQQQQQWWWWQYDE